MLLWPRFSSQQGWKMAFPLLREHVLLVSREILQGEPPPPLFGKRLNVLSLWVSPSGKESIAVYQGGGESGSNGVPAVLGRPGEKSHGGIFESFWSRHLKEGVSPEWDALGPFPSSEPLCRDRRACCQTGVGRGGMGGLRVKGTSLWEMVSPQGCCSSLLCPGRWVFQFEK